MVLVWYETRVERSKKRRAVRHLAERAWSHFGHVELLFNNAGVASGGPLRYEVDAIIARMMAATQKSES